MKYFIWLQICDFLRVQWSKFESSNVHHYMQVIVPVLCPFAISIITQHLKHLRRDVQLAWCLLKLSSIQVKNWIKCLLLLPAAVSPLPRHWTKAVHCQPEKSRQLLFTFSCKLEQFWGREQIKVNNQCFSQIKRKFEGLIWNDLREHTASVWQLGHQRKIILAWLFQQLWLQSKIIKFLCVVNDNYFSHI